MQCRLCHQNELKFYYSQGKNDEFKFYKCTTCGLVNYDLSTGLNQIKYAGSYTDPLDETKKMNISQRQTFQFIKSKLKKRGKAFDIGCGNGKLLYHLKQDGWSVRGLELSTLLAVAIQEKLDIDVDVADFMHYNPPNVELFDLVILRHVLEHLPDPLVAMKKINSFLNIEGHAILEFPNIEALELKIKRYLQRKNVYSKKYDVSYKPGHCNEYSRASFEFLAAQTGFEIMSWETYSLKQYKNMLYNRIPIGNKARTIIRKIINS